jgi:hypothetical protein
VNNRFSFQEADITTGSYLLEFITEGASSSDAVVVGLHDSYLPLLVVVVLLGTSKKLQPSSPNDSDLIQMERLLVISKSKHPD